MVRIRDKDGSIVRRGQPRRRVPTSMHGQLIIDQGHMPYYDLSIGSDGRSLHAFSHSSTMSSSIPLSYTPFSIPPSSIPSSSNHQRFRFSYRLSTLSPYHIYVSLSPQPTITDQLPYPFVLPTQPLSYVGTIHNTWAILVHHTYGPLGPSSFTLIVHHTSSAPLHQS